MSDLTISDGFKFIVVPLHDQAENRKFEEFSLAIQTDARCLMMSIKKSRLV